MDSFFMRIFMLLFVFVSQYSAANFDWSDYSSLLADNITQAEKSGITSNLVNYQAFANDPKFHSLINQLASYDPSILEGNDKMAFYINTYNIFAINLVIENKPHKSIRNIGSWFSPVWQKPAGILNGKPVSLDTIEHKILRKMEEPRIHFAIVCASMSCPDLRKEAYVGENLDRQLEDQTRSFLADKEKGLRIDNEKIYISKIFDWFSEDFSKDKSEAGILQFIAKYQIEARRFSGYKTLDYDWQLNKVE
jgi:hypothetical protein|tara:strand:+ start:954 stop:1703 length:750 start_codon:yes stop_codon:yes gene_type:complete